MNKEEKNMERYTLREGGRVLCPTERLEAALERLAAFEDLACGLEEEQQSISQRLEELRGQRKEKDRPVPGTAGPKAGQQQPDPAAGAEGTEMRPSCPADGRDKRAPEEKLLSLRGALCYNAYS